MRKRERIAFLEARIVAARDVLHRISERPTLMGHEDINDLELAKEILEAATQSSLQEEEG